MQKPLFDLLTSDTVLVTAGQRLCRHFSQRFAQECQARGQLLWETPAVFTFGSWLRKLWEEAVDAGVDNRLLLTIAQESVLWERVIDDSERGARLLSVSATANLAREAWSLAQAWEIPSTEIRKAGHEDVQAFASWADDFDALCRTNRWIDNSRLPNALIELIAQKRLSTPRRMVVAGFDEYTPQQARFLQALRNVSVEVVEFDHQGSVPTRVGQYACASADDEVLAAARWVRAQLTSNPLARIGVLAPDLSSQHREIRRIFDDVLLPEAVLPGREEMVRPYNVSLGEPLATLAPIQSAFAILEFAQGSLPLARLSELLGSPYLAGSEIEHTRRALLDARLREVGDVRVSVAALARALERIAETPLACPILAERLQFFRDVRAQLPRVQPSSRWLNTMERLLTSFGWPGDRPRSSVEHQIIEAARELFGEFGALESVTAEMAYGEALTRLRRLAQEKLFQRETPETPVQILGILEASGLEFDALWVMGLHDDVWPSTPRPNPFLPIAIQRTRGLPHASAERELDFCARLTERMMQSAPEVVLSYPLREEDRDMRPSPLIRALPSADWVIEDSLAHYRDDIHRLSTLETMIDATVPELVFGSSVRGGTALFRAQSACPFRAVGEFRLGARAFPVLEPGLGAKDRGNLIHDTLARLWQELGSHAAMIGMAKEALAVRVAQIATEEVEKLRRRRPDTVTDRLAALERERLAALVQEWLEIEALRAPFKVRREEVKMQLSVAGLVTEARMDRVDELEDGTFVVIDYKTGEANPKDWFGERPAEPQLPLYALYGVPRTRVTGLFYGCVRRGKSEFRGFSLAGGVAPNIKPYAESPYGAQFGPWENLVKRWDATLVALAEEHRSGHAHVSPRDALACKRCHLHGLCRVHERSSLLADVADGEERDD